MSSPGQLSFEMYKWLSSLQIITSSQKYKSNGNIQLDSKHHEELLSGQSMAKLVEVLAAQMGVQLNGPLLSSIKKSNTPASRVYNWNILSETYSKIGVNLSKEMQKEITSGNFEELKRFLLQIQRKMGPKKIQKVTQKEQQVNDEIDFAKIDKMKSYQDCEHVIEVIVKMISKNCGLTTKQAFSTLSQNLKYFSHMIVKGIKNSYDQIQDFFNQVIQNMPHLLYLSEKDPARNTSFLLQLIKPSLISRQPQVALYGSKALKQLVYQSMKYNEKNLIYQILSGQQAGFDFIYMGIKRHPHLVRDYIIFLHPMIQNTYKDFFQVHLKSIINNEAEYIKIIIILLEGIRQLQQSKKSVIDSGLLKTWVKMCQDSFNQVTNRKQMTSTVAQQQAKILSLELMCDLWKMFSTELDQNEAEDLLMKGIQQLKKNTRKDNYLTKISALNRLFDFLDYLANQKNRLAAIVYKKTIFLFFQNHENLQLREVILQNFMLILKKFQTIPLQFLLDPLLKQLMKQEGVSYVLNIFDFQFFIQIFKHPRIQPQWALNYLQYFTKLYTKNIIYSGVVIRIIELLCSRFCEQQTIMEYIIKNVESSLNVYGILAIGKKTHMKGREENLMNSQKKSLVIELIKFYVKLENKFINDEILANVIKLYVNWMDTKRYNDKGLYYLLTLFGDAEQMVMKHRIQKENYHYAEDQHQNASTSSYKQKNTSSQKSKAIFNDSSLSNIKGISPFEPGPTVLQKSRARLKQPQDYNVWRQDSYLETSKVNSEATESKIRPLKKLSQKSTKPQYIDSKTLQDIQIYKMKYRRESQRKRSIQEKNNVPEVIPKVNQKELIQRHLSLGYNKMLKTEQLFYEFDTVKTKYLKEETQLIDIQAQQERDILSTKAILKRYQKQIETLFYKYTAVGHIGNRAPSQQKVFITFTDLNRLLKQKNLNKLPKIVINEIITYINRKKKYNINVLVGVEEKQFPQFLILFTNLYLKEEKLSKDEAFGFKIQKILMKMFQGEVFFNQLTDKKAQDWFKDNQIQKIPIDVQQKISLPEGYKKIVNQELYQDYSVVNASQFNISQSYEVCLSVLNDFFKNSLQIDIFPAISQMKKMTRLFSIVKAPKVKIPQNLTEKTLKKSYQFVGEPRKVVQNKSDHQEGTNAKKPKSNTKRQENLKMPTVVRTKSHKEINYKKSIKTQAINQDQILKKHKQQQQYAKKLREELQAAKKLKQKKLQQQKQKKEQQQKQKQKKQQKHKKYLEENKRKLQEKKDKDQKEKKQNQMIEKQQNEKKKQQVKQKQKALLEKMQKHIQQKKEKFEQVQKSKQKHLKILENIQKKAKNLINEKDKQVNVEKQKEKRLGQAAADPSSQLNTLMNNYEQPLKILFEQYWNWKTQKIELKQVALMMKNFKVSPEYIPPKLISQTFKTHGKGDSLTLDNFKQLLIKYCYKSQKLAEQIKQKTGKEFQPGLLKAFLQDKLYMKELNYVQTIKMAKLQQL